MERERAREKGRARERALAGFVAEGRCARSGPVNLEGFKTIEDSRKGGDAGLGELLPVGLGANNLEGRATQPRN